MGKKKAEPETAKTGEEDVLKVMRKLTENGITEFTSTLLRDKLGLDKESGRDQIRRVMRKLEKAGKVVISQKVQGKRKQYIFKLAENTVGKEKPKTTKTIEYAQDT